VTQIDLFPELTPETPSYHLAIPASPLVSPESKEAQRMTATSGRSLAKLLHTKDPLFAFSKMFMVTLPWASTRCLLTWKPKITPRGRLLCQLAPSTPRTDATGSGSSEEMWATPNTMDHLPQRSAESTEKMKQGCAEGQSASEQSEGASEPRHDANVGNAAHNGRNGGAAQAKRERAAHQSDQSQSGLWGKSIGSGENVADTDSERGRLWHTEWQDAENVRRWNTEPRICHLVDGLPKGLDRFDGWEREPADIPRVATGVKDRVSRLKGLGNAIVPSIAMQIGLTIKAVRDA
jgi:hypothetical protein